jgi:hypothetical protein
MIGLIEQVGTFTPEMRRLRLALRQSFVDSPAVVESLTTAWARAIGVPDA